MAFTIDPSYYSAVQQAESGGDPSAANPNSSATGLYQFTDPTYLQYARKFAPDGTADADLLKQRTATDPVSSGFNKRIMEAFTTDNGKALDGAGIPVNNGNLYAAHFLGAKDAQDVLKAPDADPVSEWVEDGSVTANPFLKNMTVGQFKAWAASYGKQKPGALSPDVPSPGAVPVAGALTPGTLPGGGADPTAEPQQPPPDIGDALSRLSAAFFRRDSPNTASAMDNALNQKLQQQQALLKAQQASNSFTAGKPEQAADGKWYTPKTNDKTGETVYAPTPKEGIPMPEEEDTKLTPAEQRAMAAQGVAQQNLGQLEPVRDAIHTLRDALQKGTFEVGPDKTGQMVINNITGNSTENDRYLKSMQSNIINAASIVAQSQKGSMTNFKFAKDMEQVMPAFAANDKKAAYEALTRVSQGIAGAYNANVNSAVNYAKASPKLKTMMDPTTAESVPVEDYYKGKMQGYATREKALQDNEQSFLASPGRAASATNAPQVGLIKNGYKYTGGPPGDQASWQKVD